MGTASKVIASATVGTIAAVALTTLAVVRAGNQQKKQQQDSIATATATATTTATKQKEEEEDDPQNESYKRAPLIYYKPSNESDIETYEYANNDTVYGKLLRAELKMRLLLETEDWVAFEDISPRAPLHGLIVPKKLVRSVLDFQDQSHHLPLLQDLRRVAHGLLRDKLPLAYERGDYKLCFHIPPLNSVDHLHLHVLAPVSEMSSLARHGEFHTKSDNAQQRTIRWNIALDEVIARLETGKPPTPFRVDDNNHRWTTAIYETVSSLGTVIFPGRME